MSCGAPTTAATTGASSASIAISRCRQPYYTRMAVAPDNPDETYFLCATFNHSLDGGATLTCGRGRRRRPRAWRRRTGRRRGRAAGVGVHVARRRQPRHLDRSDEPAAHGRRERRRRARSRRRAAARGCTSNSRSRRYITSRSTTAFPTTSTATSRTVRRIAGRATAGPADAISRSEWHGVRRRREWMGDARPGRSESDLVHGVGLGFARRHRHSLRRAHAHRVRTSRSGHSAPAGIPPAEVKYRFIWDAPFTISPHDHNTVYTGSQFVHMTKDGGRTWQVISPISRATTSRSSRSPVASRRTTSASSTATSSTRSPSRACNRE